MQDYNKPAEYEAGDVAEEIQAALFDQIEFGGRGVISRADYDRASGVFILTTNGEQRWRVTVEEAQ